MINPISGVSLKKPSKCIPCTTAEQLPSTQANKEEVVKSKSTVGIVQTGASLAAKLLRVFADLDDLQARSGITTETTTNTKRSGPTIETTTTRRVVIDREKQNNHVRNVADGVEKSVSKLQDGVLQVGNHVFTKGDLQEAVNFFSQLFGRGGDYEASYQETETEPTVELGEGSQEEVVSSIINPNPSEVPLTSQPPFDGQFLAGIIKQNLGSVDPILLATLKEIAGDLSPEQLGTFIKEVLK